MSDLYGEQHLALQQQFDTRNLAERVQQLIVLTTIDDNHRAFIESRDLFFLTTVDHRGYPTCSYKGGAPGFVNVVDEHTLVFPSYDGNGMYLSMGNITANDKVGLLFIDFATPHRLRVHGHACIETAGPLLARFPGAELPVRVTVTELFVNCPRYIHPQQRLALSPYVPVAGCAPKVPQWKRIDAVQDALPARDQALAQTQGGTITPAEYGELLRQGRA